MSRSTVRPKPDDRDQEWFGELETARAPLCRRDGAVAAFAKVLPQTSAVTEFVNTAWRTNMQRTLTGQITTQRSR